MIGRTATQPRLVIGPSRMGRYVPELLVFIHTNSTRAHTCHPVEVAHWPAKSFKVALGDHALTLRDDVEIGFVPPAVADRKRGQVAGLVGPGLAICAAAAC